MDCCGSVVDQVRIISLIPAVRLPAASWPFRLDGQLPRRWPLPDSEQPRRRHRPPWRADRAQISKASSMACGAWVTQGTAVSAVSAGRALRDGGPGGLVGCRVSGARRRVRRPVPGLVGVPADDRPRSPDPVPSLVSKRASLWPGIGSSLVRGMGYGSCPSLQRAKGGSLT